MKTVKFKNRINNAVEAFFAADNFNENQTLVYRKDSNFLQRLRFENFFNQNNSTLEVLKRTCVFFPGTFVLFFISFGVSYNTFVDRFHPKIQSADVCFITLIFFTSSLMTWFGIGKLTNSKHCAIPLSIIAVGVFAGLVSGFLPNEIFQNIDRNGSFPFYFFPLALIVPFLAKGFVDRKKERQ